jgi:hypothetical protein
LAEFGKDCNCSIDIPAQTVEEFFQFDIPDLSNVVGL